MQQYNNVSYTHYMTHTAGAVLLEMNTTAYQQPSSDFVFTISANTAGGT